MTELTGFVEEVQSRVETLTPEQIPRIAAMPSGLFASAADFDDLSQRLETYIGKERVAAFCEGFEASGFGRGLLSALDICLQECFKERPDGSFAFDRDEFLKRLTHLADAVTSGLVEYTFSLRIINIDIAEEFTLGTDFQFRRLDPETVQAKYPVDQRYALYTGMPLERLQKHQVEASFSGRGTPAHVQQLCTIEAQDAMINSIRHAFILADVTPTPDVTHIHLDSPIHRRQHLKSMGRAVSLDPPVLDTDDVVKAQHTYALLKSLEADVTLRSAADRFILGKKQSLHHPNRINEPHWDKIVDYVIALETLLLTGSSKEQLSYRFRLNGSWLLRCATGADLRRTFHALNDLYSLRSAVVHGGGGAKRLNKLVNDFARWIEMDLSDSKAMRRLLLVSGKVEEWIMALIRHLNDMPAAERPFNKPDGWEEMLWANAPPSHSATPK